MTQTLRCPHCGALVDGMLNPDGREEPREWQPLQCAHCGQISTVDYSEPGNLRPTNEADWRAWRLDPVLMRGIHFAILAAELMKDTD